MNTFAKEEQSLREEMVRIAASFFQRGYATGSAGNLSLLLPDGNLLATPTGSCLGNLQAEQLSKVTLQGEWLSGDKPSKEVKFHLALYRHNPACKAVVHLHSAWSTALSCLEGLDTDNAIRPFTPYVVMRMGDVPVIPYYRPGDERIATELAARAAEHSAFLLANHGPVVCGSSLQEAANNLEELEETAKLIFILGDRPIRYLTAEEIAVLRR
ncbi:aldolase [Entomohabitans teleogrylli]|uniref:3-oxo-tetronate 4-phosphate decarboxylase n=1 Tax=Entomohabitans teleogrylli TaxID=1384589 RepID=UPI00073D365C|nr:aldolase [Entomohabitans teleogrylli]